MAASFLTVLGNADSVRWVLSQERMAFTEYVGQRMASRLAHGDRLFFYASMKCWPGLGGARPSTGMVVADSVVLTDVHRLPQVVSISGRRFSYGCQLFFEGLAALGSGVPLNALAGELDLLAGKSNYGQVLQRTPILLSQHDAELLKKHFAATAQPFEDAVSDYLSTQSD